VHIFSIKFTKCCPLGSDLPEAYRKFWAEWKYQKPAAVHYIPKEGMFERNEKTGEVFPVQNVPLPIKKVKVRNKKSKKLHKKILN
jgi:hypothetical protein